MFVFGFLAIFVVNQIFIYEFWKKISFLYRIIPLSIYIVIIIISYCFITDSKGVIFVRINEVIRIPLIEFGFAIMIMIIMFFLTLIYQIQYYFENKLLNIITKKTHKYFKTIYLIIKKLFWVLPFWYWF